MDLKRDFVELARREGTNFRQLCRQFGVSAPTGYKWLERYLAAGAPGLQKRSRRPISSPGKTDEKTTQLILDARLTHPAWGARKLRKWLQNKGHENLPQPSTITEILRRNDLLHTDGKPVVRPFQRFERERPNELWQMDFKGWLPLGKGGRCYPLTVLDDHSRFNILLEPCGGETIGDVRPRLEQAFGTYGLPQAILCDNGNPWADPLGYFTAFEAWLMRVGVDVYHGRIRHPQTQGKEERFHRTLKAELLSRTTCWRDLDHCQQKFAPWREIYNHERPHAALGDAVPASRYEVSSRSMPIRLAEASEWYEAGEIVRRVKSKGEITFKNVFWSIGRAFSGQDVALRPVGEQRWEVFYCWKCIGIMDFESLEHKPKGNYERLLQRCDGPREEGAKV